MSYLGNILQQRLYLKIMPLYMIDVIIIAPKLNKMQRMFGETFFSCTLREEIPNLLFSWNIFI